MIGGVAVLAIIVAIIAYGLHKKKSNVASFSNGKLIRILFFFFLAVIFLFIYFLLLSSFPFSSGLIVDDVSLSLSLSLYLLFFFLRGGGGRGKVILFYSLEK